MNYRLLIMGIRTKYTWKYSIFTKVQFYSFPLTKSEKFRGELTSLSIA